ncbi:hypothetical protein MRX96_020154 [Rhipicephalus microplus]
MDRIAGAENACAKNAWRVYYSVVASSGPSEARLLLPPPEQQRKFAQLAAPLQHDSRGVRSLPQANTRRRSLSDGERDSACRRFSPHLPDAL